MKELIIATVVVALITVTVPFLVAGLAIPTDWDVGIVAIVVADVSSAVRKLALALALALALICHQMAESLPARRERPLSLCQILLLRRLIWGLDPVSGR